MALKRVKVTTKILISLMVLLKMFDFCLAPDTTGDGTGCDNMTCVIVRFNKLLDDEKDVTVEVSKKRKAGSSDTEEDCSVVKRSRDEIDETECKDS